MMVSVLEQMSDEIMFYLNGLSQDELIAICCRIAFEEGEEFLPLKKNPHRSALIKHISQVLALNAPRSDEDKILLLTHWCFHAGITLDEGLCGS